jgi:bacillithiol system protein YtxJ
MGIFKNWLENKPGVTKPADVTLFEEMIDGLSEGDQLLIFKASPRCGASLVTEKKFDEWYNNNKTEKLKMLKVNVIEQKPLSSSIAERYKIRHESPQLIWLDHEENVVWHGSHSSIKIEVLDELLGRPPK